jgi:carbon-monoxide dehydrogenase large subunit
MSDTGIGARVARLEDQRFITGKGNYTDDVNVTGQTFAAFRRSEYAHATVKSINAEAAMAVDGVVAVLTGDDLAADGVGLLPAGWMIHSKDGSPMVTPGHPCLVQGKARYVGDPVAVVIGETLAAARAGAEAVQVDYDVHEAVVATDKAASSSVTIHDEAANNTAFNWELGDSAAVSDAFKKAHHITKLELTNNRLIPNPMEPRAAVGDYDSGKDSYTLHTTSQNPHVARLVMSAFLAVAPEHKLRVIAPDVGGGFGPRSTSTPKKWSAPGPQRRSWAVRSNGPQNGPRAFLTMPMGVITSPPLKWLMDDRGKVLG